MVGDRSSEHSAAVRVDDDGEVNPSFTRSQIGDIANSHLVQFIGPPFPFHRVHGLSVNVAIIVIVSHFFGQLLTEPGRRIGVTIV